MRAAYPVILIGGTGDVGRRLQRLLLKHTGVGVVLVSRRSGMQTERSATMQIDITSEQAAARFPQCAIVVNLTEATPPVLAAEIVRKGGMFLDTSASPQYLDKLECEIATAGGSGTGVLCVGTAPGLSTLMAADLARREDVASINVALELGMGRHYGPAATTWFFRTLGTEYTLFEGGHTRQVVPGALRQNFAFGKDGRSFPAIGIGFPDIGISPKDRQIAIRTFLAVDPSVVTRFASVLLQLGLGPWMAHQAQVLTRTVMRLPSFGQTRTRIAVEARGNDGRLLSSRYVAAGDQAELTAAMVLATLRALPAPGAGKTGLTTITDHLTFVTALMELHRLVPGGEIETWGMTSKGSVY